VIRVPEDFELSGLDALGARQFHIVDDESGDIAIKAACRPIMLSPGFRAEFATPIPGGRGRPPKRPGFVSNLGQFHRGRYWEVLTPGAFPVAAFRCRPYWVAEGLTVKMVSQRTGREVLDVPGAAPFPKGTVRRRRGPMVRHGRHIPGGPKAGAPLKRGRPFGEIM
jgi:hypothetical protein